MRNMEAEALLKFIEERLKKIHKPDPELVKKHNADPYVSLGIRPARSTRQAGLYILQNQG
ncbi:hypothetical protein J7K43_06445 [Candidatus Calescamantes bacterium]|nr:hypothetical protein [Candidatus Calescamantes bacterium]